MRDRIRQGLRKASPKAKAFLAFFLGTLTTVVLDRALKLWVPEGQEGSFLIRVLQWARDILSWVRTDWLLIAAATALLLYLWDERSLLRERLNRARVYVRERLSRSRQRSSLNTYVKYSRGQILASSNVRSVADEGSRRFRINFEMPLDTGSFVVLPIGETPAPRVSNLTSTSVTITMPEDGPFKLRFEANPASERAKNRLMEYLPPNQQPVATGVLIEQPQLPLPKKTLTPYEVDQKLKLIDKALAILRDDFPPTYKRAHQLEQTTWSAFKKRERHEQYLADVKACRDAAVANASALEQIRQRHPEHQDISAALQRPSEGNSVETVLGHYLVAFQHLISHVKDDAPSETVNAFMGPRNLQIQETLRKFENWRNNVEKQLIELRRTISP